MDITEAPTAQRLNKSSQNGKNLVDTAFTVQYKSFKSSTDTISSPEAGGMRKRTRPDSKVAYIAA